MPQNRLEKMAPREQIKGVEEITYQNELFFTWLKTATKRKSFSLKSYGSISSC
jgi:hypothetical protein